MEYGEVTFILKLTITDPTTDANIVVSSHSVESLYRGSYIEDYNEELTQKLDALYKRYEALRKLVDDRLTLTATISMVSPFLVRPIVRYLRRSSSREFIFNNELI